MSTTLHIIDIAIELAFIFPVALAAFNVAAKRQKKTAPQTFTQQWESAVELPEVEDDGAWLEEIVFVPAEQWEPSEGDRALVEVHSVAVAQYWANVPTNNVVEFKRPVQEVAIDLASLGIRELRKVYSQRGCKGLRLSSATKAQLLEVLSA